MYIIKKMKIIFLINILLISSCVSVNKRKTEVHNDKTALARKISASKSESSWYSWIGKACPFTLGQAVDFFEVASPYIKIISVFQEGNYIIFRLIWDETRQFSHGKAYDFAMHKCATPMSTQSLIVWLEEAQICSLSDAKKLFTAVTIGEPISPIGRETPVEIKDTKQDEQFYYLNTSDGKVYKVGKGKECLSADSTSS